MLSFCQMEFPWWRVARGVRPVNGKNLCLAQKIHKWQNFLQISWNLGWESQIKYHAQPKRLWPKFGVDRAFSFVFVFWPTVLGAPSFSPVFLIFLSNHDTCVKSEGGFSSLAYYGQNPLSILSNLSFISQKHHLSKTYPDVWNREFVEMKGNEGDKGLLNSLRKFWK